MCHIAEDISERVLALFETNSAVEPFYQPLFFYVGKFKIAYSKKV